MHVRFIAEDLTVRNVEGIIWFEDTNMIVNTKPSRFTFTNVVLKNIVNDQGVHMLEVQGMSTISSGTGDAPELFRIQIFLE